MQLKSNSIPPSPFIIACWIEVYINLNLLGLVSETICVNCSENNRILTHRENVVSGVELEKCINPIPNSYLVKCIPISPCTVIVIVFGLGRATCRV